MTDYVLVHGSWMGAWAWDRVSPILTAAGHTVRAISLPGDRAHPVPVDQVTLQAYADAARRAAAAEVPVVLVGHSSRGARGDRGPRRPQR